MYYWYIRLYNVYNIHGLLRLRAMQWKMIVCRSFLVVNSVARNNGWIRPRLNVIESTAMLWWWWWWWWWWWRWLQLFCDQWQWWQYDNSRVIRVPQVTIVTETYDKCDMIAKGDWWQVHDMYDKNDMQLKTSVTSVTCLPRVTMNYKGDTGDNCDRNIWQEWHVCQEWQWFISVTRVTIVTEIMTRVTCSLSRVTMNDKGDTGDDCDRNIWQVTCLPRVTMNFMGDMGDNCDRNEWEVWHVWQGWQWIIWQVNWELISRWLTPVVAFPSPPIHQHLMQTLLLSDILVASQMLWEKVTLRWHFNNQRKMA